MLVGVPSRGFAGPPNHPHSSQGGRLARLEPLGPYSPGASRSGRWHPIETFTAPPAGGPSGRGGFCMRAAHHAGDRPIRPRPDSEATARCCFPRYSPRGKKLSEAPSRLLTDEAHERGRSSALNGSSNVDLSVGAPAHTHLHRCRTSVSAPLAPAHTHLHRCRTSVSAPMGLTR
jgi:hypothetical protein